MSGQATVTAGVAPYADELLDRLEARLGDPLDEANPLGFTAVVAADERRELLAAGEAALSAYQLNADFVPAGLGGRLAQADRLAHRVRAVFRRDCTLAIGYGVTSLIGSLPLWTAGTDRQQRHIADLMLGGGRVAAAYTELPHGADFTRAELSARLAGDWLILNGRKDLINNVSRAEAVVVFARTADGPGSRSHSHILVEPASLPTDRYRRMRRYATSGVRGCLLGAIEFEDCPVPADQVVGALGSGMETVLRAFQITRTVLPGMVIGGLDTQLRVALKWVLERRLYGRLLADLAQTRHAVVSAFVDLLICDSLATSIARALHLLPEQTSGYAAAVKHLVPALLQDASYELSVLLGARGYLREGEYGVFQKYLRDLPVVTLAHASSAVCLASILPQLPRWARRGLDRTPAPAGLFRPGEALSPLSPQGLAVTARGQDDLIGTLLAARGELAGDPLLGPLYDTLVDELACVVRECLDLPPRDSTVVAGRRGFDLAARYAVLLAAAACIGVWLHGGARALSSGWDDAWLAIALRRLIQRLGRPAPPIGTDCVEAVWAELRDRYAANRTFDLLASHLCGRPWPRPDIERV